MEIRGSDFKDLVAIDVKGRFKKIPNKVMRKLKWAKDQNIKATSNSVCICCNYVFHDKTRGWSDNIGAICHPFRDTSIFPDNKKLYLLSESDFCDSIWMGRLDKNMKYDNEKKYEFFYFTIDTSQGVRCKGYHLLPTMAKVAKERGKTGFVLEYYLGTRPKCVNVARGCSEWEVKKTRKRISCCKNINIHHGKLTQGKITKIMSKCKYVIFPNTRDASPRIIPESLIRGMPILVNKNIYGGWKYVNKNNGILFDGPMNFIEQQEKREYFYNELKNAMIAMSEKKFDHVKIKEEYYKNFGFYNTSRKLAKIINNLEGHKKYCHVFYKEFAHIVKTKTDWVKL